MHKDTYSSVESLLHSRSTVLIYCVGEVHPWWHWPICLLIRSRVIGGRLRDNSKNRPTGTNISIFCGHFRDSWPAWVCIWVL